MAKRQSIWSNVREVVRHGSSDEVAALACPKCGAGLSLKFDADSPQPDGTTAGCLKIACWGCESGCVLDGLSESPGWVDALGVEVKTCQDNL